MARQEAIEKWRSRAHSAEDELATAIELIQALLDTNRSYEEWHKDERKARRLYQ